VAVYRPRYKDHKTKETRESAVWWYRFYFAGKKYEGSTGTEKKTLARAIEKRKREEAVKTHAGVPIERPEERTDTVTERTDAYIRRYELTHGGRPKSVAWVRERTAHLRRLLGRLRLHELSETRIEEYMSKRLSEGAGNRSVNMELENLSRALGKTWRELWPKLSRLEEPSGKGRRITEDEQRKLLEAAARNRSRYIYPYLMIESNAVLRADEVRLLRWGDVDLMGREFRIGRAKSEAGAGRMTPMNHQLFGALSMYASWYMSKLGELRPEWFVFPFSSRQRPVDPTRPITTLKTAWSAVRAAAGVQCRLHDFRHTTATRMLERGIPPDTVKKLAGWISPKMIDRYYHPNAEARREAVKVLEESSAVVQAVVQAAEISDAGIPANSLIWSGGRDRTRTCDLLRVKQAL
jgi:integrase